MLCINDMETVNLSSSSIEDVFDISKCLFCQQDGGLVSNPKGRDRIKQASEIRNDRITKILNDIGSQDYFYHVTNKCYKSYTNRTALDRISKKRKPTEVEENTATQSTNKRTRGHGRPPPNPEDSSTYISYTQKCIICDQTSYKKDYSKYRMSEPNRAKSFLQATIFFQDSVFTRTCHLQDENAVFGADLYYHKSCLQKYLYKYDSLSHEEISNPKLSPKQVAWNEIVNILEEGLNGGKGYELSAIRDYLNTKLSAEDGRFSNRDVKVFLESHFADTIDFTYSAEHNKCMMVFSILRNKSGQLAETIRSIDPFKVCASIIRKHLSAFDFNLNDRFCDAEDLRESLSNIPIPEDILRFFGEIYNFYPESYHHTASNVLHDCCCYEEEATDEANNEAVSRTLSTQ